MDTYNLEEDINIMCVQAKSFPAGIQEAFDTLARLVPQSATRPFYGISHGAPKGGIIYKAAMKELEEGEAEKLGFEPFVITKGNYLVETIMNWHENIPSIGQTFMRMLGDPRMDKNSPCVEWYKSEKELLCMVKIK